MKNTPESFPNDWTGEIVSPGNTQVFTKGIVWGSIDELYRQEKDHSFVSYPSPGRDLLDYNLNFERMRQENDLMEVRLKAAFQWESTPNPHEIVSNRLASISLDERVLSNSSKPLYRDRLEVHKRSTYQFGTTKDDSVLIEKYFYLSHPVFGPVDDELTDGQRAFLQTMGPSYDSNVLTRQDCIEIGGFFGYLGVPDEFLDTRMSKFSLSLETTTSGNT